jgi:hypothetical protein
MMVLQFVWIISFVCEIRNSSLKSCVTFLPHKRWCKGNWVCIDFCYIKDHFCGYNKQIVCIVICHVTLFMYLILRGKFLFQTLVHYVWKI